MARTKRFPSDTAAENAGKNAGESADDSQSDGPTSRALPGDDVEAGETRTARLFSEMIPTDYVRILRENDVTRAREFHGSLNFEQATPEYVTALFGGGTYRLQLIRRGKSGDVIHRSMALQVPGAYRPPVGSLPGTVAVTGSEAGDAADTTRLRDGSGMSPREMLDYAALSRLMEVMKQPVAAAPAGGTMLRDLAPIVAPLVAALGTILVERLTKGPASDPAIAEIREALHRLQDKPGPAVTGLNDVFDAVEKFSQIRDKLTGGGAAAAEGGNDGDMWKGILRTGMEFLAQGRQGPPPQNAPPGTPGAPAQLPPGSDPAAASMPPWYQMLQEYRGMLVEAAQKARNPSTSAGIVVEYCPDNYRGTLHELAQATNTETLLVQAVPELQHFPAWVTEFVEEVRAQLFGEEDDTGDGKEEPAK